MKSETQEEIEACSFLSVGFPLFCAKASGPLLEEVAEVDEQAQEHDYQVELQDVGEAEREASGFRQRNTEEFGFIKNGDRLDHRHSFS